MQLQIFYLSTLRFRRSVRVVRLEPRATSCPAVEFAGPRCAGGLREFEHLRSDRETRTGRGPRSSSPHQGASSARRRSSPEGTLDFPSRGRGLHLGSWMALRAFSAAQPEDMRVAERGLQTALRRGRCLFKCSVLHSPTFLSLTRSQSCDTFLHGATR